MLAERAQYAFSSVNPACSPAESLQNATIIPYFPISYSYKYTLPASLLPPSSNLPQILSSIPTSSHGTPVFICTPCHPLTLSPSTSLTNLCCFNIPNPLNLSLVTSIAYILPQPPLTSLTSNLCGSNSLFNRSKISFSASSRWDGAVRASLVRAASDGMPASPWPIVPCIEDGEEEL